MAKIRTMIDDDVVNAVIVKAIVRSIPEVEGFSIFTRAWEALEE